MGILCDFVCMMCCGIVIDPIKCVQCETLYCSKCLPKEGLPGALPDNKGRSYNNPAYTCYKKCGSNKTKHISRLERNIRNIGNTWRKIALKKLYLKMWLLKIRKKV